jgi:hypothetical protein
MTVPGVSAETAHTGSSSAMLSSSGGEVAGVDQPDLDVGVEPVDVAGRFGHPAVRDALHDALVCRVGPVRAPQVLVPGEPLGGHLAHEAYVLVVAEHLLDLEAAVVGRSSDLVDDRLSAGHHAAHAGGYTGDAEDRIGSQQFALAVERPIAGGLL